MPTAAYSGKVDAYTGENAVFLNPTQYNGTGEKS
jgi:hypothetical protein